jgi:membrane-bound ClpP family serine protease
MWKRVNTGLIKTRVKDWAKVLLLLLDEVVIIVLVIIALRYFNIHVPLPIIIIGGLLAGALIFIVHKAIIPCFHKKIITGSEGMIGKQGRVMKPLVPVGTVAVGSEQWRAKSVDDNIETNEYVEIVGLDQLTLKVKRWNSPQQPLNSAFYGDSRRE